MWVHSCVPVEYNLLQYYSLSNPPLCLLCLHMWWRKVCAAHYLNVEASPAGTHSAELWSVLDFWLTMRLYSTPTGLFHWNCSQNLTILFWLCLFNSVILSLSIGLIWQYKWTCFMKWMAIYVSLSRCKPTKVFLRNYELVWRIFWAICDT